MADAPKRRLPLARGSSRARDATEPPKRHLPIVQAPADEDAVEERPPRHWIVLGVVATFIAWLPLAGLVSTVLRRWLERVDGADVPASIRVGMVGLNVVAFALAAAGGGFLVGRFGGRAGVREATLSGATVAAIAWVLACAQGAPAGVLDWAVLLVVMMTLGAGAARVGGRVGTRTRAG